MEWKNISLPLQKVSVIQNELVAVARKISTRIVALAAHHPEQSPKTYSFHQNKNYISQMGALGAVQ